MTVAVSLTTLQSVIADAIARGKHDRKRIEKAAALLATGHVERVSDAMYQVRSQTRDDVTYTVTADGCTCTDAERHPGQRCKHDLAVRIAIAAQLRQERHDAIALLARFAPLDAAELARLTTFKREYTARSEAPR